MQSISVYRQKTLQNLEEAQELLYKTYALTNDRKIFLSVLLKIYSSLESALNTILNMDVGSKDSFSTKVSMLKKDFGDKLKLTEEDYAFFTLIMNLKEEHKDSSVEFARKDKFVIAEKDYTLHSLSYEILEEYLNKTKNIIAELLMRE